MVQIAISNSSKQSAVFIQANFSSNLTVKSILLKASIDSSQFLSFFSHVFPYFLEISLKLFFLKSKYFMLLKNNPNETGKLKIGAIWKHCIFSNLNVKVLVKDKVICVVGSSRDLLPKQPTMQLVCMVFTFLDFFF